MSETGCQDGMHEIRSPAQFRKRREETTCVCGEKHVVVQEFERPDGSFVVSAWEKPSEAICDGEDMTCPGCLSGEHGKQRRHAFLGLTPTKKQP